MSYAMKDGKGATEEAPTAHRIRITLTSRNVKSLEKGISIIFALWHFSSPSLALKVFQKYILLRHHCHLIMLLTNSCSLC